VFTSSVHPAREDLKSFLRGSGWLLPKVDNNAVHLVCLLLLLLPITLPLTPFTPSLRWTTHLLAPAHGFNAEHE
jgi:hypothetical protein